MKQYLNLLEYILANGKRRTDRTGVGTISIFGYQTKYDLRKSFPLITTKRIGFQTLIKELLWFCRGETNIRRLVSGTVKCNIWNDWPYKAYKQSKDYKGETMDEFIQKIIDDEQFAKIWGELGPVYGKQWRDFSGVDQLQKAIDTIKNNPDSRRNIVCAWNPPEIDEMAKKGLPPCHTLFQFYVDSKAKTLSCQLYQRSGDSFLGVPFNVASYAALTCMIAAMTGLKPGEFVHTLGDAHIYLNHVKQVKTQLKRKPTKLPILKFKRIPENISDWKISDFELIGYNPQESIKGEVAV
ncbi:MAG: thymidylate synthase [Mycoplasmoidaceae bacterium]|nr:MAG: thymidylate synthase [Mycoplasmoidaceae bacterium]